MFFMRHVRTEYGLQEFLFWVVGLLVSVLASLLATNLTHFRISPGFLSDAVAFEAVVVSVAVPVGLDVVGRLYDKYGSNQVKTFLAYRLPLVPLLLTVFTSVVLVLSLKAGLSGSYPALTMLAFIGGIAAAVLFWLFINRVVDFAINEPTALLECMGSRIDKEFGE